MYYVDFENLIMNKINFKWFVTERVHVIHIVS